MATYNEYLTKEAQEQSNNGPFTVYKVRRPKEDEEVITYANSDCWNTETPTEQAAREGRE